MFMRAVLESKQRFIFFEWYIEHKKAQRVTDLQVLLCKKKLAL